MRNSRPVKYVLVVENVDGSTHNVFQGIYDELVAGQQLFEYKRGQVARVMTYVKYMTDLILSTVNPDEIE